MRCHADWEAAEKDAKSDGMQTKKWKTFHALKMKGGQDWRDAISTYRSKCEGKGSGAPRGRFDWVRYVHITRLSTVTQRGSRGVMMGRQKYIKHKMTEEDLSREMATELWDRAIEDPKDYDQKGVVGAIRAPGWPNMSQQPVSPPPPTHTHTHTPPPLPRSPLPSPPPLPPPTHTVSPAEWHRHTTSTASAVQVCVPVEDYVLFFNESSEGTEVQKPT
jgi:hypothetical protein